MPQQRSYSLDHLIRSRQHVRWDRYADLLCRFQIDDEFELRRLLNGNLGRLGPLQDFVHIRSSAAKIIGDVWRLKRLGAFDFILRS